MIGVDLQPLSVVENVGFRKYSAKLQPLYSIPLRKVLTNTLIPHYVSEISLIIKSMLAETSFVSVATDIWSSDSNKSFCSVTCHFIYNDKQENVVLETKEIPGSHTGINIANCLSAVFDKWEINNKTTAIVTDNGANVKAAVTEHLKKNTSLVQHTL